MKKAKYLLVLNFLVIFVLIAYLNRFSMGAKNFSNSITTVILSLILALAANFIKAYIPKYFKVTVVVVSMFLVQYIIYQHNLVDTGYILFLLPITLAVLAYGVVGGVSGFIGVSFLYWIFAINNELDINVYLERISFIGLVNLSLCFLALQTKDIANKNENWLKKLHVKINELSLLKEIGASIQTSTSIKKINKIVLTSVTSGYGLGFNRALLFFLEGEQGKKKLKGEMAIGPLSQQEAYRIWGNVVRTQDSLDDVIAVEDDVDQTLNEYVRKVVIDCQNEVNNPLVKASKSKEPIKIEKGDPIILGEGLTALGFENYVIVPLVAKNESIGVLLVDNKFNGKVIAEEDVDSLITFATQWALAIENTMLYEQISKLAITDGLTGLYNHRYFKEQLSSHIEQETPFCLLVIDIDDFKEFNELYGHACGDNILAAVSKGLKKAVGKRGIISRYGGDEFTVILPGCSRREGKALAIMIQGIAKEISGGFNGIVKKPLTLSVGMGLYPYDAQTGEELFLKADNKLKMSKLSGKDTIT